MPLLYHSGLTDPVKVVLLKKTILEIDTFSWYFKYLKPWMISLNKKNSINDDQIPFSR